MNDGSSPHARGTLLVVVARAGGERFIPACAGNTAPRPSAVRSPAVHPRMRGEHGIGRLSVRSSTGSSPHARGTQRRYSVEQPRSRFIPACAGNTQPASALRSRSTVHPRMRGEHTGGVARSNLSDGSSPHARGTRDRIRFPAPCGAVHPRMRGEHRLQRNPQNGINGSSPHALGTRGAWLRACRRARFIPACAGNTVDVVPDVRVVAVHPRMRGEHAVDRGALGVAHGSSPHARGTRTGSSRGCSVAGFIPACAGNTAMQSASARPISVHPRMRGEHGAASRYACEFRGSSPHARGTRSIGEEIRARRRFIPACAGNTVAAFEQAIMERGSSPHARGTLTATVIVEETRRFIPACAGNTLPVLHGTDYAAVHPRMRGEHRHFANVEGSNGGSSPHARGTQVVDQGAVRRTRFIPACAGNTNT